MLLMKLSGVAHPPAAPPSPGFELTDISAATGVPLTAYDGSSGRQ